MHDKSWRTKEKKGQEKREKTTKDETEKRKKKFRGLLLKEVETLECKHALGEAVLPDKALRGVE